MDKFGLIYLLLLYVGWVCVQLHALQEDAEVVNNLQRKIQKQNNSMTMLSLKENSEKLSNTDFTRDADLQLIAVIDEFQSLQKLTVLKHVISRNHENRLRNAWQLWINFKREEEIEDDMSVLKGMCIVSRFVA